MLNCLVLKLTIKHLLKQPFLKLNGCLCEKSPFSLCTLPHSAPVSVLKQRSRKIKHSNTTFFSRRSCAVFACFAFITKQPLVLTLKTFKCSFQRPPEKARHLFALFCFSEKKKKHATIVQLIHLI